MTRRYTRNALLRLTAFTTSALFVLWNLVDVHQSHNDALSPQPHFANPLPAPRVFIASLHYNNAALLRDYWNDAIVELSKALGPANVFVAAYESGSVDGTKGVLLELDGRLAELGVQRSIMLSPTIHADEIAGATSDSGWVRNSQGIQQLRRIPYLARLRNLSLEPLGELAKRGRLFDKILFLNDVVFQADDVLRLLDTNNGNYAAACALDFVQPPEFYDTFALFDIEGDQYWTRRWPYFRSSKSREALMHNKPVPVKSCWNGMAIFDASPFYNSTLPLRFRAIPDSLAQRHVEASECCLIHVDNALSETKGVWINPNVRVGYSGPAYSAMKDKPLCLAAIFTRVWYSRLRRWFTIGLSKDWIVMPKFAAWEAADPANREAGNFCLLNEMQILTNEGWTHI